MRRDVVTVQRDDTVLSAARLMRDADIGMLVVVGDDRRVVGVVTDRDLAVRVCAAGRDGATTRVVEVMSPDPIACRPEHPLGRAEALMAEHRLARMIVTDDDGVPRGVISISDIAQYERPARLARTLYGVASRKYRSEAP